MACPKCGCKVTYQYDDGADLLQEPAAENLERCAACGEVFDIEDHAPRTMTTMITSPPPPPRSSTGHEWDDDAVCIHCGFDGAEWHHWKHHTYEGKAQPEAKPPLCTRRA